MLKILTAAFIFVATTSSANCGKGGCGQPPPQTPVIVVPEDNDRDPMLGYIPRSFDYCCLREDSVRIVKTPGRLFKKKAHAECAAIPIDELQMCSVYQQKR